MQVNHRSRFWTQRRIGAQASAPKLVKIMLIDDDEVAGEALAMALSVTGFETRYFSTGGEGLTCLSTWVPAIAVLDINMPGQDGFDVASLLRLHSETCEAGLIAFTSMDERSVRLKGIIVGFDAYCQKGAGVNPLLEVISTLMGTPPINS